MDSDEMSRTERETLAIDEARVAATESDRTSPSAGARATPSADARVILSDDARVILSEDDGLEHGSHEDGRPINRNLIYNNPEKWEIGRQILERYTGTPPEGMQKQILLTNFEYYSERFSGMADDVVTTRGSTMTARHSQRLGVSLVNFSVGSPVAALIIEVLATAVPKATLCLGMWGALHRPLK